MTVAIPTGEQSRPFHLTAERAPFVMLPRWLLYHREVSEGAKFLYCVLHDLVAGREGPTRPVTRAELATVCGVSADTIDRRLAQLVAVRAVEKEHQIRAGGQQANVYRVWLTPPDGLQRTSTNGSANRSRGAAAPVEGGANGHVGRSRESAAPPSQPHGCGTDGRTDAAPNREEEEENQEQPPQPPRRAGGPSDFDEQPTRSPVPRRAAGTNPRARQANPRSEAELAETARLEAEIAARQAELERTNEARRTADLAARAEADRLEAEALAVSAALNGDQLDAVVQVVTRRMAGPLARSPLAISRAVVAWCRAAAALHAGPFSAAVDVGLAAGVVAGEGSAPLDLPTAPAGMTPLRHRIAGLRAWAVG